ncbi:MAG: tRNA lysidine(34) synthetase TilS [Gaiellaceae bacterium]|jgi:tRNA(Ile)-lysidine synthase
MKSERIVERIELLIRAHDLIEPGGEIVCLVSGGADSTCLWHSLGVLGYRVTALHVNHHQRGEESEEDARFCCGALGAEVVEAGEPGMSEAELRELRYSFARDKRRATGHTASDQVETIIYRLASSGSTRGIKVEREDGIVRPLLSLWREETEAYCHAEGLPFRTDSSNPNTVRGLIRSEILPALRQLHPAAEENILALARERPRLPRGLEGALLDLLSSHEGSRSVDLRPALKAVREYDRLYLEQEPLPLVGSVRWGPWLIESELPGLQVRCFKPGDRLAGRKKKIQDVFVNAKVPRSQRRSWPLVAKGEEIVAVPGIVAAPGFEGVVRATREEGTSR